MWCPLQLSYASSCSDLAVAEIIEIFWKTGIEEYFVVLYATLF